MTSTPKFQLGKLEHAGPLTHLMMLVQLKGVKNSASILTNLTVAALHLGYLLENPFHGEIPDLPDSPDKYMIAMAKLAYFLWYPFVSLSLTHISDFRVILGP